MSAQKLMTAQELEAATKQAAQEAAEVAKNEPNETVEGGKFKVNDQLVNSDGEPFGKKKDA